MEKKGKHVDKRTHFKAKHADQKRDKYKKFIGNKAEGQGFADKRKKKIQYEYMKMLKKEKRKNPSATVSSLQDEGAKSEISPQKSRPFHKQSRQPTFGKSTYSKIADEAQMRKTLKERTREEAQTRKQDRDAAMEKYQTKKKETFKKICKKTHKGQPVMKNQIEYLLQKIEKQINQT